MLDFRIDSTSTFVTGRFVSRSSRALLNDSLLPTALHLVFATHLLLELTACQLCTAQLAGRVALGSTCLDARLAVDASKSTLTRFVPDHFLS